MKYKLLVVTPWVEEWEGKVKRFPEVKFLKRKIESVFDYDVVRIGDKVKGEYDVVFVQSERAYPHGKELFKAVGAKKLVVAIYGVFEYFPLRRVFTPLHRWRYRAVDRAFKGGADVYLITDDGSGGEIVAQKYKRPYVLLPNPKPPWDGVDKLEARKALGLPLNGSVGGFAGALNKLKGAHLLGKIYEFARETYRLTLIGDGPLLASVERLARKYPGKIFILEPLPYEKMNLFYSAVDFVLAPYLYGNKTAVVIEALSLGVPVVAFEAHVTKEIVKSGWNGFLASNFDVKEFARYTLRLATDPILRESMSEAAKVSAEGFPTWEHRISLIAQALIPE